MRYLSKIYRVMFCPKISLCFKIKPIVFLKSPLFSNMFDFLYYTFEKKNSHCVHWLGDEGKEQYNHSNTHLCSQYYL